MRPVLILASAALAFTGISLLCLRKLNEPAPSGIYESPEANVVYKARKEIDDLYARADWTKANECAFRRSPRLASELKHATKATFRSWSNEVQVLATN